MPRLLDRNRDRLYKKRDKNRRWVEGHFGYWGNLMKTHIVNAPWIMPKSVEVMFELLARLIPLRGQYLYVVA